MQTWKDHPERQMVHESMAWQRSWTSVGIFVLFLGLLSGCQRSALTDEPYGRISGVAGDSVQGARLLADRFRGGGFRVSSARTLGRMVERADVVVWIPDRMDLPSRTTIQFFDKWLSARSSRTLVYIGRDYSPQLEFWNRLTAAKQQQQALAFEMEQQRAVAQIQWEERRKRTDTNLSCPWFTLERLPSPRMAERLSGLWVGDDMEISLQGSAQPMVTASIQLDSEERVERRLQELLRSDDDVLVASIQRPAWQQSQLVVASSGALLLNLPLARAELQPFADRLVAHCGNGGRVVFLASGSVDPPSVNTDNQHHLLRVFTTAPLRCILMHLAVMGGVYCLAVFPAFGRLRQMGGDTASDFGLHVQALGRLLRKTGDEEFARQMRHEYAGDLAAGNPFRLTSDDDATNEATPTV